MVEAPLLGLVIQHGFGYSVRNHASLAAVTVLVYEYLTTLYLEVGLIWRTPFSTAKGLFLICRYIALGFQIGTLAFFFSLEYTTLSRNQCLVWHYLQIAVFHALLFSVEQVQAKRVDALYSDYHRSLQFLALFRYVTTSLMVYSSVSTLHFMAYDEACLVSGIPWHVTLFGGIAMSNQVILSALLIYPKIIRAALRRPTWVTVMTRDALFTFSAVGALLGMIIAAADTVAHVMPSVFITILSISGCRMTTNLLSSGDTEPDGSIEPQLVTIRSEGIQLSSVISLEDGIPTLRLSHRSSRTSMSPAIYSPSFR